MDHDTQGPEMLCGAIVASDDAAEDIEMALAGSANQRQFIEDVVALVARFDHWSTARYPAHGRRIRRALQRVRGSRQDRHLASRHVMRT